MSSLVFIFIITLMFFALSLRSEEARHRKAVDDLGSSQKHARELAERVESIRRREAELSHTVAELETQRLEQRKLNAELAAKIQQADIELARSVADLKRQTDDQMKIRSELVAKVGQADADLVASRSRQSTLESTLAQLSLEQKAQLVQLQYVKGQRQFELRQLRSVDSTRRKLLKQLQAGLRETGVKVDIDVERGLLRLPAEILFESGEDRFVAGGEDRVRQLAEILAKLLPTFSTRSSQLPQHGSTEEAAVVDAVFLEGHTDDRPLSAGRAFASNWELSAARAIRTHRLLVKNAPSLESLRNDRGQPILGVSGYADSRPAVENLDDTSRAANRRIDLRFLLAVPRKLVEHLESVDDLPLATAPIAVPSARSKGR